MDVYYWGDDEYDLDQAIPVRRKRRRKKGDHVRTLGYEIKNYHDASRHGYPVSPMFLLQVLAEKTGLDADLLGSADEETARKILSLARYAVLSAGEDVEGLAKWQLNHQMAPYGETLTREEALDLYLRVGKDPSIREKFFQKRRERYGDTEVLVYECPTPSFYGEEQDRLFISYGRDSGLPLGFCTEPGNIPHSRAVERALKDQEGAELITDEGLDLNGRNFIMPVPLDERIRREVEEENPAPAVTRSFSGEGEGVYLHIYRDKELRDVQERALEGELKRIIREYRQGERIFTPKGEELIRRFLIPRGEDLEVNQAALLEGKKFYGISALLSTERDASRVLMNYRKIRWLSDFFAGREKAADALDDTSREGRRLVRFVALCYYEEFDGFIREMRKSLGDSDRMLRDWLEEKTPYQILDWFDKAERQEVGTPAGRESHSPGGESRDLQLVRKFGIVW